MKTTPIILITMTAGIFGLSGCAHDPVTTTQTTTTQKLVPAMVPANTTIVTPATVEKTSTTTSY